MGELNPDKIERLLIPEWLNSHNLNTPVVDIRRQVMIFKEDNQFRHLDRDINEDSCCQVSASESTGFKKPLSQLLQLQLI